MPVESMMHDRSCAASTSSRLGFALRRAAYRALERLDRGCRRVNPGPFVLCYHSISTSGWRFAVRPRDLRRQLEYLMARYCAITARQLEAFVRGVNVLPQPSFVISFDDGYRDLLDAEPVLREMNVRPLLFALANPERVEPGIAPEGMEFLSGAELRHLRHAGWEIGCHSSSHPDLTKLDEAQLLTEIAGAKQRLESVLGSEVRYFAYPKGRYNQRAAALCAAAGYQLAFSMDDGALLPGIDPFTVPRIGVDGSHSIDEFRCLTSPSSMAVRGLAKFALGLQGRPF